jgi:hypothetical protein
MFREAHTRFGYDDVEVVSRRMLRRIIQLGPSTVSHCRLPLPCTFAMLAARIDRGTGLACHSERTSGFCSVFDVLGDAASLPKRSYRGATKRPCKGKDRSVAVRKHDEMMPRYIARIAKGGLTEYLRSSGSVPKLAGVRNDALLAARGLFDGT